MRIYVNMLTALDIALTIRLRRLLNTHFISLSFFVSCILQYHTDYT